MRLFKIHLKTPWDEFGNSQECTMIVRARTREIAEQFAPAPWPVAVEITARQAAEISGVKVFGYYPT